MSDSLYLIEKHGLYYRPNAAGYTGIKAEAGRYSYDDAVKYANPNGPDAPRDGISMRAEADAPEYSPACAWEVKLRHQAKAAEAENAALRAEIKKLKGALLDIFDGEPEWPDQPEMELSWCRNRARAAVRGKRGE